MTTVLVLTSTFPAARGDGTPQFVLDLTTRIDGVDRFVVVTPRVPNAAQTETIDGVEVRRFAYFWKRFEGVAHGATLPNVRAQPWRAIELPFLLGRFLIEAWRAVRSERPDLIHAHWVLPGGLLAAMIPGNRAPIVMTAHGVDMHALQRFPLESLRRFALRRANHVVAVSGDLLGRVGDLAPSTPVEVVPMGTDLAEVTEAVAVRAPVAGRVAFVGRLADKKGVDVLIRAVARQIHLHLVIAGDGPERLMLESLVDELGVRERVTFLGHSTRTQVFDLMRTCEVLAMPSVIGRDGDQEGTPVVLAEACAAGVPMVASRLGGIAEFLDDATAWLVTPGDVDALAGALGEAHRSQTERKQRAALAQSRVAPLLDMERTVAAYERIYGDLIA
jgi:glycosyltransferase involved in cell wall biosynthesis